MLCSPRATVVLAAVLGGLLMTGVGAAQAAPDSVHAGTATTGSASVEAAASASTAASTRTAKRPPTTKRPRVSPKPVAVRSAPAAGAPVVGLASYPVPAGAIVIAPTGDDAAPGTVASPRRSVAKAVLLAPRGATIVLRGGTYRESVIVPDTADGLTIQPYPSEAVWFDGSVPLTQVRPCCGVANRWGTSWTTVFDASPTFTRGAPDGTEDGWRFVDPAYPMAANPDQVWIDDVPQRQVATPNEVVAGTFAVDPVTRQLVIGTYPAGRRVEAGRLGRAFLVTGTNTTLRGFGIRRYNSSVPDFGVVSGYARGLTLDSTVVQDSATVGVGVNAPGATLRATTIERSGLIGVVGYQADGLVADRVALRANNSERFNASPIAGGLKTSASRGVTVRDSLVESNLANGLWFDESTYDMTLTGNTVRANAGRAVFLEISARGLVEGNSITDNAAEGLTVANTSDVTIRGNTILGNKRAITLTQDGRLASDPRVAGHDKRYPNDPAMTWELGRITVRGNTIGARAGTDAVFGVEDFTQRRDANARLISADGDTYVRPAGSTRWAVVWTRKGTDPFVYDTLAAFRSAQRQELSGREVRG